MNHIVIKLRDNTEIELDKEYLWISNIRDELNDTRTQFINIGDYIFAKDIVASVMMKEVGKDE